MKPCCPKYKKKNGLSSKIFLLSSLICFFMMIGAGCSSNKNFASVRNIYQDTLNGEKLYEVKQGDTLYSIGFRSGHGYQRLAIWNNISSPYLLQIGQKIKLFQYKQQLDGGLSLPKQYKGTRGNHKDKEKNLRISTIKKKVLKFDWQWPLKGSILKKFSGTANKGIDIVGKLGQKVYSAAAGKVVYSGSGLSGYGNLLIIKHNYLYLSAYANNKTLLVKEGQNVKKGQVIAEVGRLSGRQASLHFEIRKNGKPVNPLNYLPKI